MPKINDLDWLEIFHQKQKEVISLPRTMFCYCNFNTDFILIFISIDIKFLKIHIWHKTLKTGLNTI